jgi:hypothetical protein
VNVGPFGRAWRAGGSAPAAVAPPAAPVAGPALASDHLSPKLAAASRKIQQSATAQKQSLAGLTQLKAKVAPPIRSAAARGARQAREGGQQAAHAVGDAAAAQARAIDQTARQAHDQLGAHAHGEVDAGKLEQAVGALTGSFTQIHSQGAAAVRAEAAKVRAGMAQSEAKLTANLDRVAAALEAKIAQAVSGAHQGAAQWRSPSHSPRGPMRTTGTNCR